MTDARRPALNRPILLLLTLTGAFATSMPVSCMPVLFKEISDDLGLSLVQIGTIWGMSNLAGIFVSIIGGVISDRLGLRLLLGVFSILVGLTGALRGVSDGFFTLTVFVFLNGVVRLVLPISATKAIGMWFKGPRLGTAMGVSAMGIGLGLTVGPMISATLLSPLLGGWRNVMFFYGALSLLVGLVWTLFAKEPAPPAATIAAPPSRPPVLKTLLRVARIRVLWLISFGLLFRTACTMGVTGYLPLYLRGQGWGPAAADGTLAVFYGLSAFLVVPLCLASDRLRSRKAIFIPATVVTTISVGLLPFADGAAVWVLSLSAGMFLDSFMSVLITTLLETEEIGPAFSGTAIGIVFSVSQIGAFISPPFGNSLAEFGPGVPFFFWAGLSLVSLVIMSMVPETAGKSARQV